MEKAGKYSYYLVELTEFSNVSIINDIDYLNQELKEVPYKKEAKEYLLSNPFVKSTPLNKTFLTLEFLKLDLVRLEFEKSDWFSTLFFNDESFILIEELI